MQLVVHYHHERAVQDNLLFIICPPKSVLRFSSTLWSTFGGACRERRGGRSSLVQTEVLG